MKTAQDYPEPFHLNGMAVLSRSARLVQHKPLRPYAPGFLPGALGGMVPEIRHSMPSTGFPPMNRVTLQREISPSLDKAVSDALTSERGSFIASAIS